MSDCSWYDSVTMILITAVVFLTLKCEDEDTSRTITVFSSAEHVQYLYFPPVSVPQRRTLWCGTVCCRVPATSSSASTLTPVWSPPPPTWTESSSNISLSEVGHLSKHMLPNTHINTHCSNLLHLRDRSDRNVRNFKLLLLSSSNSSLGDFYVSFSRYFKH